MDLTKSHEYFQPEKVKQPIHLIGCGAIGSSIGMMLARAGVTNITLYDFDIVESHNIANQMYTEKDLGRPKVEALADLMTAINPDLAQSLTLERKGWDGQRLEGYVFLAVDSIDLRRRIATENKRNCLIKAMFDFRMRLEDAQSFAADWRNYDMVESFIKTMNFTQEEADQETPVSACNIPLSFAPTVMTIVSAGIANFVNFVKGGPLKRMIIVYPYQFGVIAP